MTCLSLLLWKLFFKINFFHSYKDYLCGFFFHIIIFLHIVFKNIESLFSHTYFPEIIDGNQIVVNIGIFD